MFTDSLVIKFYNSIPSLKCLHNMESKFASFVDKGIKCIKSVFITWYI